MGVRGGVQDHPYISKARFFSDLQDLTFFSSLHNRWCLYAMAQAVLFLQTLNSFANSLSSDDVVHHQPVHSLSMLFFFGKFLVPVPLPSLFPCLALLVGKRCRCSKPPPPPPPHPPNRKEDPFHWTCVPYEISEGIHRRSVIGRLPPTKLCRGPFWTPSARKPAFVRCPIPLWVQVVSNPHPTSSMRLLED